MPLDNLLYYPVGGNAFTEAARTGDASLDLDLTSKLDPRITFTRASVATVTTADGQVLPVKTGEARFEGCTRIENLCAYSPNLQTAQYVPYNGLLVPTPSSVTFVNANSDLIVVIAGYRQAKGQFIASFEAWADTPVPLQAELVDANDGSDSRIVNITLTKTRTRYFVYADYSASSTFSGSLGFFLNRQPPFNIVPGSTINFTNLMIEDVSGTGRTTPSEYVSVGVLTYPFHGAGVDGVKYVTTAQEPLTARGLLMEEPITNQQLQSQSMGSAPWTVGQATIPSYGLAPDGTYTAAFLREDATASAPHYVAFGAATYAPSTTYTRSIYAKAGTRTWFALQAVNLANVWMSAYFNLTAGTVPTIGGVGCTATIVPVGGGWFRCTMTYPSGTGATASNDAVLMGDASGNPSYNGDGTSGLYLWGAQLEALDHATSYIPTAGTTVARSADRAEITSLPAMTPGVYSRTNWWNASAGTLYAEFSCNSPTSDTTVRMGACLTDSLALNNALRLESLGVVNRTVYTVASSSVVPATPTRVSRQIARLAASYDSTGCTASGDGSDPATLAAGLMTGMAYLGIGCNNVANALSGCVRRVAYWPHKVSTAAQLKRITS
jgi:hypothetical protein